MPISGNIRKFKFDLTLSDDRVFEPLSDDLLRLTKKSLLEVVERVFSKFDGKNIVIDKIEIDLGNLNPSDLNSLVRKFKSELEDFVQNNLDQSTSQNQARVNEAALFFIQKGYFPWWIDSAATFNEMVLKWRDSLQFSEKIMLVLTAEKQNYFRLINVLNAEAKHIVYQKLLLQNETIFKASISFFEDLLIKYQLPKIESQDYIMEEIEYFLVEQFIRTQKDPSSLFFKALKYFSRFFSIPFSNLFQFITEKVIHAESNQVIKSLIEQQKDLLKDFSPSVQTFHKIHLDKNFKSDLYLNNVKGLIYYIENDIPQLIYTEIELLKQLLDSLLAKKDIKLVEYLKSIAFYNNKEKLARLAILLDPQNYLLLNKLLSKDTQKFDSLISINDFIKRFGQDLKLIELVAREDSDTKWIYKVSAQRGEERQLATTEIEEAEALTSEQTDAAEPDQAKKAEQVQFLGSEQEQAEGIAVSQTSAVEPDQAKKAEQAQFLSSEQEQAEGIAGLKTSAAEPDQAKKAEQAQFLGSEQEQAEGIAVSQTSAAEPDQAKKAEQAQFLSSEQEQAEGITGLKTSAAEPDQAKKAEQAQFLGSEQEQAEGIAVSQTSAAEPDQAKKAEQAQFLGSEQEQAEGIAGLKTSAAEPDQVRKFQKIEASNLEQLIAFFEVISLRISFSSLKELKKILDSLLEKRDKDLFDYLSTPKFYKNQQKLSRLISLLKNENYQMLIAFLSNNRDQLDSVKYINDFIVKANLESAIFELNEGVKAELTNEEVLKTRLLSEDPISILRMYFEKGMSKANFTIISEYSKILELLLETNVHSLIEYLTKKNFLHSEIKLERFFSLLSEKSLQKLIDLLSMDDLKLLIDDLDQIFSDRSFIKNVSAYTSLSNITYKYKKSLLIDLLVNTTKKRSPSSFISSLIERVSKESSLGSNELLFEFSKMRDKKKYDRSIVNIFEALYSQINEIDSESSKSEEQAIAESKKSPIAPLDVIALLEMSTNERIQFLINLFKQLPNTRLALEKFVFHQAYSKVMTLELFSKVFQSLKVITGLDFAKRIQSIINLIDPQIKNQFLLLINRVAFQIVVSKGISNLKDEDFSESLTTTLIHLYPQIFKKYNPQRKAPISVEENALQRIIKKVSERSKAKTKSTQQHIDIEKFDSLLRLKQDILDNQLSAIFSEEIIGFHDSFDSIVISDETLLAFLSQNYMDHELIMSFSEITLQSSVSRVIQKILKKENSAILQFEEEFLEIQQRYNIVSLNISSFKIILRTFLFKKLGSINDFRGFSAPKFSIDFLEDIKRENYLNFQQLSFFLRSQESKKHNTKLVESFEIFNTSSKFSVTNPKLKNELFYKDLVFGFLETGKIPEWASIENFTLKDAILFIKSAIASSDQSFLTKLFTAKTVVAQLLDGMGEFTENEINKLYQLIHLKSASFDLYKIFELLKRYFENTDLSSSLPNQTFFLYLTLRERLWMQTSLISFVEKLYPFIQPKAKKTKKQLLIFIAAEFAISKRLIELEKNTVLTDFELIEVLKYYLEFNQFPKHLKLYAKEIQLQIQQILLKETYVLRELLREFKLKPQELERLFSFISLETIIDSFHESSFKEQSSSYFLADALKKLIKSSNFKKKTRLKLLINLATSFEYSVTKITLTNFYKKIKKEDVRNYDQLISILIEKIKTSGEGELDPLNKVLDEVNLSQQTEALMKKQTIEDIDLLDYYLEIGSVNFENRSLSKHELYQILLRLIKNAELRTKKMVFEWVKSSLKLNRLMGIIPKNERQILMNLIHPDLFRYLNLFSDSMEQVLKIPIEKLLSIKTKAEIELKIIQYWIKKNIYLDSPFHLIVHLFEEVLENKQLTSTGFFKDFRDTDFDYPLATSNFIFTLKRTYDNYKNQLPEEDQLGQEGEDSNFDQEDTDAIVIQNAGLIILWPFFYRLFDKCGFLIDRKFKDELSVQKGILIMQFLVTGSLEINENELVLNKILCGVAQRTPVDVNIEIEEVELELCESLLKGVLQNWEKLNNSSVATLRETFLMREGILTPNELDYNLDIVKETFDMLLETIPWNISMIQTTFMENRINVDWK